LINISRLFVNSWKNTARIGFKHVFAFGITKLITSHEICCTSKYVFDFTSPAKSLDLLSLKFHMLLLNRHQMPEKSINASEIWSAILSGCPLTDSDVKIGKYYFIKLSEKNNCWKGLKESCF
jgi:hypothetical protein